MVSFAFIFHYSENMTDGTDRVRWLSKLVLGNADRLEVAAAVARAEAGRLFARALADELRWADNRVQKQLKQFEAAGLLVALPSVGGERRVYYRRTDSAFWQAAPLLEQEWRDGSEVTTTTVR
jgi:DNA-binding MarR family transcriptional regulator